MIIYYSIVFLVLGLVLGSFYNVVGDRLPNNESIITPRSHCPKCGHQLKALELIPVVSYILLKGRCRKCKCHISIIHPLFELLSGFLFMLSYLVFGLSIELLIALTFISMLLIVIISDYHYMIICDEVLIIGSILLIIEMLFVRGTTGTGLSILDGVVSFIIMFLIKKIGDFFFKRESMGGGDIKLMFTFGLVIGVLNSIVSIFLASIIGLPISLIMLHYNKNHEVPFGPYLSFAAIIILLTNFDVLSFYLI